MKVKSDHSSLSFVQFCFQPKDIYEPSRDCGIAVNESRPQNVPSILTSRF